MKIPTQEECLHAPSESFKYAHLAEPYLHGCGVDVGSQGWPVVPWAISMDLPEPEFSQYCGGAPAKGIIHLRGRVMSLPFRDATLDWVYSSHVIEDFALDQWRYIIGDMARCVRPGGFVVTVCPEASLWAEYVASGGIPNYNHKHEGRVGDFAAVADGLGLQLVSEGLTGVYPGDYSMWSVIKVNVRMSEGGPKT